MSAIAPFNEITTKTAVRFSLDIAKMELSVSATFRVSLYDANNSCFANKYVTLEGQDYLNWGTDDKYVLNFIAKELGLTLIF
jgi:hypothetical protein